MGRIQELLNADEANTRVTPELMKALHPWTLAAFDDTSSLYRLLYRVLVDWPAEHAVDRGLRQMARANGLSDEQLIELLKAGQANHIDGAPAAWQKLWMLQMVKYPVMAVLKEQHHERH